jgi:amidase
MSPKTWEEIVANRRQILNNQIPNAWRLKLPSVKELPCVQDHAAITELLNPIEVEITNTSTLEIIKHLQSGQWTSEETVTAFCKRAALAQQALNCATDLLFDEAIKTAKEYDSFLKSTGKTKGPLHGLPISIKDAFDVAGHITSCGLVSRLDNVAKNDTLIVSILREAGAIPFVKTNTSQACLLVESINNVYGTVLNPWNRNLSAGGSSGGEGALVAFRGSPLGVGTDGGGSLRIPASWNGLYTLKPTAPRIPGFASGTGYSDSNSANYGPFAHDLDTIGRFCDIVLSYEPWLRDPAIIPLPWKNDVQAPKKMKLGLLLDDGVVHFAPPVLRCLRETAEALSRVGHEVIELGSEWAHMHRKGSEFAFKMYTEEGGIGLRRELEQSGEPLVPRVCTGWSETPLTPMEIWANHRDIKALRIQYLQKYRDLGLDALITAPMPHPAPPHGEYITSAICAVYNALDLPSCTIPCGRVDLEKDVASEDWYNLEPYDDMPNFPYDRYDRDMKRLCELLARFCSTCAPQSTTSLT